MRATDTACAEMVKEMFGIYEASTSEDNDAYRHNTLDGN